MNSAKRVQRGVGVLVVAFCVLAIVLGALFFRKFEGAKNPSPPAASTMEPGTHPIVLFFAAESGEGLVREWREVESCDKISICLEDVLEELINGPVSDLAPVLPSTGMFNSVRLDGEIARVDFARELLAALPAGSNSEMLAVYAVVDSLAANFPQVHKVLFTLDGAPLQTLKGHVDVRSPIEPDYSLVTGGESSLTSKEKR